MYEVDFTGWVRTPEELEKIKYNWKYRLYLNYKRFFYTIKYKRYWQLWQNFLNMIFNKNEF